MTEKFRIISFNIRYGFADDNTNSWKLRADSVGELLQDSGASIILVQEALNFQLDQIQHYLGGWWRLGVGRDDGGGVGEHCAILYYHNDWKWIENGTFWLSETPSVPGSKSWGAALPRICTWAIMRSVKSGRDICVFNTHLDHQSVLARKKSASLICQYIQNLSPEIPIVVAGDFNESLQGSAVVELCRNESLQPVWSIAHPQKKMPGTYHGFTGNAKDPAIDHVMVNRLARVVDCQINSQKYQNRWPSDHFPIIVELDITT